MNEERLNVFLELFDPGNSEFLADLEKEAYKTYVPVIRKGTQSMLRVLLAMRKPRTVLEVGTAIGFSSLLIAENSEAHITTIENYKKRIPIARENFRRAGMENRIDLMEGDAQDILPTLAGPYDFIFMDAAKGQYIHFLPDILRLLDRDGVLVTDNILQEGETIESHYAVERRNRTIYKRMRDYLTAITSDNDLKTTILPVGDGLAITVKVK